MKRNGNFSTRINYLKKIILSNVSLILVLCQISLSVTYGLNKCYLEEIPYYIPTFESVKSLDGSEVQSGRHYSLVNQKVLIINSKSFDVFEAMKLYYLTSSPNTELTALFHACEPYYRSLTLEDFDLNADYKSIGVERSDLLEVIGDTVFFMDMVSICNNTPFHPLSGYSNKVFTDLVHESVSNSPFLRSLFSSAPLSITDEKEFVDLKRGYEALVSVEQLSFPYFLRVLYLAIYSDNPEVSEFAKNVYLALGGAALRRDSVFLKLDICATTDIKGYQALRDELHFCYRVWRIIYPYDKHAY